MTSNVGAKSLLKDTSLGFRPVAPDQAKEEQQQYDRMRQKVLEQLKTEFRPEFLNRVDSVVVFKSLQIEQIRLIVELLLDRVRDQRKPGDRKQKLTGQTDRRVPRRDDRNYNFWMIFPVMLHGLLDYLQNDSNTS
jgi:ATP-dependent Clp protease ATP-binding subunit ClpC